MSGFLYSILLQCKLDLRNKGVILTYYVVPLVFFAFMSGIFTTINPLAYKTLIPSMTVFGVTMGAIIGAPNTLVGIFRSDIKKAYIVGRIPLWTAVVNNFLSAFIHLFMMSLLVLIAAPLFFSATVPNHIGAYFMMLILFMMASLSVGTVLGLFVKNSGRLTMMGQFVFLPSIMLSGIMFPVDMLPGFLKGIGKVFPATWGYVNMSKVEWNMATIVPLIGIIAICSMVSYWKIRKIVIE